MQLIEDGDIQYPSEGCVEFHIQKQEIMRIISDNGLLRCVEIITSSNVSCVIVTLSLELDKMICICDFSTTHTLEHHKSMCSSMVLSVHVFFSFHTFMSLLFFCKKVVNFH